MTPDELIKWHEKCADNASSRGAHTIASKHAKTVHFMRAALEPIAPPDDATLIADDLELFGDEILLHGQPGKRSAAPPDVAQAARVLLDHDIIISRIADYIDEAGETFTRAKLYDALRAIAGETP